MLGQGGVCYRRLVTEQTAPRPLSGAPARLPATEPRHLIPVVFSEGGRERVSGSAGQESQGDREDEHFPRRIGGGGWVELVRDDVVGSNQTPRQRKDVDHLE